MAESGEGFNSTAESTVFPFASPCNMFLAGQSQSGKSYFIRNLLEHGRSMFEKPVRKTLFCYSMWQRLYDELETKHPEWGLGTLEFHKGLPTEDFILSWARDGEEEAAGKENSHKVLVLDDMIEEVCRNLTACKLFTVTGHHANITVCILSQSLFPAGAFGKYGRTVSLNSHYLVLFKNNRDRSQIVTLAKQVCPGQGSFLQEAFIKATEKDRYGYLLLDLSGSLLENEYRYRTNIFPGEATTVFVP